MTTTVGGVGGGVGDGELPGRALLPACPTSQQVASMPQLWFIRNESAPADYCMGSLPSPALRAGDGIVGWAGRQAGAGAKADK